MIKAFILEDDPFTVIDYEVVLDELGISVCGCANSIPKAKVLLKKLNPDFALVDVYVGDRLGFELVTYFKKMNIPVIIITGHPKKEFLDKALDYKVNSFISKPVNHNTLKFEIHKILTTLKNTKDKSFLFFQTKYNIIKILYDDILFVNAEGNYCIIQTTTKKHILKKSLVKINQELPSEYFVKVQRGYIVNISKIKHLDIVNKKIEIGETSIPIGDKYKNGIKEIIANQHIVIKA